MSRVAQVLRSNVVLSGIAVIILLSGAGIAACVHNENYGDVQTTTNSQHQLTQISYDGKDGTNAFVLLKKYVKIQAKLYSFGYFVSSINGVAGNGPKYWTFFVNGKEADAGASSYITKSSDIITWKLE
ncbi:MAG TPA: DUF4430 domain-containing protein [Candidatus Saccharimonadales bacterium]|jgi:hypothetical protein|nr:DUF4430 domain-containing protein [Candidatus Saccharimonadales bacterium]